MKKILIKGWFYVLVLLWNVGEINPLPAQKVVYPGEWLYDALTALTLEQGGGVFFIGSAMTIAQVELILAEINEDTLSSSGMVLYEQVQAYLTGPSVLSYKVGALSLNVNAALQPEFYFKTNPDINWVYDHNKRQPFLIIPANIAVSSYITLEADVYLGENRRLSNAHNNYFNFPFDTMIDGALPIDTNIPKRAYLSVGVPLGDRVGINFRIGTGDDAYGRTKTGSIIISDAMKGVHYASFTLYSPIIKYTTDIRQLEVNKYLYLHHFQANLFKRLTLSLIEGVMVNAPFELRYLNPMMIFHGLGAWEDYRGYNEQIGADVNEFPDGNSRIGSFGGLSVDWHPWKYFRIYGLAAMNEFQVPGVEGGDDSTVPNGLAFQLGSETYMPVSTGYWTFGLEWVYTYPYMYVLTHKNWSYYRESYEISNDPIREWVGSPFGPDSIAGTLWVGYQDSSQWSVSLSYLFLAQGENSGTEIFDKSLLYPGSHTEAMASTPTGVPMYTHRISLSGKWRALDWLSFSLRTDYSIIRNFDHRTDTMKQGLEITLSIWLTPTFRWTLG